MGLADLVAPVAPPDRNDGQLSQDDGPSNGSGHLLAALHAQTNMAIKVTNRHKGLKGKDGLEDDPTCFKILLGYSFLWYSFACL